MNLELGDTPNKSSIPMTHPKGDEPTTKKSEGRTSRVGVVGEQGDTVETVCRKEFGMDAIGSLVKTDIPISLNNFQDAIAKEMKEVMASQLNDWLTVGNGKLSKLVREGKQSEEGRNVKSENKESRSHASFVPVTNVEGQNTQGEKGELKTDNGSSTKELFIEAYELSRERQLSRERKQEEKEEKEQEKEVASPDSRKMSTPMEKEAKRTSMRQYQKRDG